MEFEKIESLYINSLLLDLEKNFGVKLLLNRKRERSYFLADYLPKTVTSSVSIV